MVKVTIKRSAARVLRNMDRVTRQRVLEALGKLEENPERRDLDVRPLEGTGGYRLRIGDWRLLFDRQPPEDEEDDEVVIVQAIRPRGDAYKR